MNAATLLKAASVANALLFAGHTLGMPWTPAKSALGAAAVARMKSARFPVMGVERAYWDFYQGFGLTVSLFLLAFAALLWQAARVSTHSPLAARAIVRTSLAAFLGMAILEAIYFFAAPIVLTLPILVLLGLASIKLARPANG
jgi:hypothetical protein